MIKKKYKGTKTAENLMKAVDDEAMSYIKYQWMIGVGLQKDYPPLTEFFGKIARNEKEHCEIWAEELYQKKTVMEDVLDAIDREISEGLGTYDEYAKTAREEGFEELAKKFEMAACIERSHALQLSQIKEHLVQGTMYNSEERIIWTCEECGNRMIGTYPPEICPMCGHKHSYIRHTPVEQVI